MANEFDPVRLISSRRTAGPSRLYEPLQTPVAQRGILNPTMTKKEIGQAASAAVECAQADDDTTDPLYTLGKHMLIQAGVIIDPELLEASPSLLNTPWGPRASAINGLILDDFWQGLQQARRQPHDTTISATDALGFRIATGVLIAEHPGAIPFRIVDRLEEKQYLLQEAEPLRRAFAFVAVKSIERYKNSKNKTPKRT